MYSTYLDFKFCVVENEEGFVFRYVFIDFAVPNLMTN